MIARFSIDIQCDACLAVSQPLANRLDRHAGRQEYYRVRVAQVVQANTRHARLLDELVPDTVEVVRVEHFAIARA